MANNLILDLSGPDLLPPDNFVRYLSRFNTNKLPPTSLVFLVNTYFDASNEFGIPAGPLLAQNFLETANYSSRLSQEFHNMAGIGASSSKLPRPGDILDPVDHMWKQAIRYPSIGRGVRAHFAHIQLYMLQYITEQIGFYDAERAQIALSELKRIKAPKLTAVDGLNGTWAGSDYAAKIYKKYKEIANI